MPPFWPSSSSVHEVLHEQRPPIRLSPTDKGSAAVSHFGAALKAKLSGKGAVGAPEDQLRAHFESLLADMAEILLFAHGKAVAVGETTLSSLKTRPDYAVTWTAFVPWRVQTGRVRTVSRGPVTGGSGVPPAATKRRSLSGESTDSRGSLEGQGCGLPREPLPCAGTARLTDIPLSLA